MLSLWDRGCFRDSIRQDEAGAGSFQDAEQGVRRRECCAVGVDIEADCLKADPDSDPDPDADEKQQNLVRLTYL
jgi:hypothetical protein